MSLFDHLVGAREQRGWYGKAQRLVFLRLIASPERKLLNFRASPDWPIYSRRIKTAVAILLPLNCTRPRINPNYACVEFYVFFACFFGSQAALLVMERAS
jgi:hypothetical protein